MKHGPSDKRVSWVQLVLIHTGFHQSERSKQQQWPCRKEPDMQQAKWIIPAGHSWSKKDGRWLRSKNSRRRCTLGVSNFECESVVRTCLSVDFHLRENLSSANISCWMLQCRENAFLCRNRKQVFERASVETPQSYVVMYRLSMHFAFPSAQAKCKSRRQWGHAKIDNLGSVAQTRNKQLVTVEMTMQVSCSTQREFLDIARHFHIPLVHRNKVLVTMLSSNTGMLQTYKPLKRFVVPAHACHWSLEGDGVRSKPSECKATIPSDAKRTDCSDKNSYLARQTWSDTQLFRWTVRWVEEENTSTDVEVIYHVYRQNGNGGR